MKYKHFLVLTTAGCLLATVLLGCAGVKEVCKGLLGVSTKVLEDGRKDALKKEIGYDLISCKKRIKAILEERGFIIYADDSKNNLLALYISEQDTTPVGVFLTEKSKGVTLIEVSSPSTYGKEKVADVLFDTLTKELNPQAEKGQVDVAQTEKVN